MKMVERCPYRAQSSNVFQFLPKKNSTTLVRRRLAFNGFGTTAVATLKNLTELMAHDEVGVAYTTGIVALRRPAVDMLQPRSSKLIPCLHEREWYLSKRH